MTIDVAVGDEVRQGQQVAIIEAMKMEHVITAPHGGIVRAVTMAPGDVVREGYPIVFIQEASVTGDALAAVTGPDPDHIRDDLRESRDRHRSRSDGTLESAAADQGRAPQTSTGRYIVSTFDHSGLRS